MGIAKVIYGNNTLVDLTNDSVTAANLLNGVTAHAANGNPITGTYNPIDLSNDTVTPETLLNGYTAHNANGVAITGTMEAGGGEDKNYLVTFPGVTPDESKITNYYNGGNIFAERTINNAMLTNPRTIKFGLWATNGQNMFYNTNFSGIKNIDFSDSPINNLCRSFKLSKQLSALSASSRLEIHLSPNVKDCSFMFMNATLNQSRNMYITGLTSVKNLSGFFQYTNFYYPQNYILNTSNPFIIPSTANDLSGFFLGAFSSSIANVFNVGIQFPSNFDGPTSFSKFFSRMGSNYIDFILNEFDCNIPINVTDCTSMFYGQNKLNLRSITIPNTVLSTAYMFGNCTWLNIQNNTIIIPESVTNCTGMFNNCNYCDTRGFQIYVPSKFNYRNGVDGWHTSANNCIIWY